MDLQRAMAISAAGLKAQSLRMRVVAENLANKDSVAQTPDGQPYRRKVVTFRDAMDREMGAHTVKVDRVTVDNSPFEKAYMPGHPAADAQGYVLKPNVNSIIEASDMKEAQRSYEANLNAVEAAKTLTMRTIDLLR
ncbi:flagellar basal body rod protein FlgC [Pedomonas mirosovicensis]|uniref:flagellar basal body rod protein FlgC n=1 Tax=Pedomonas mirosovicensis TaxID=2908641 RepID=UPI002166D7E8|nr:flagellar basal body rod protein FlgC [Pedomonas mirosovicensis]MCH8685116.1 flagellar basal body rod protein FlgC [Pedomonas mirosovicensis]